MPLKSALCELKITFLQSAKCYLQSSKVLLHLLSVPCVKGNMIKVRMFQEDYKDIERMQTPLNGTIVLNKDDKPMTHFELCSEVV